MYMYMLYTVLTAPINFVLHLVGNLYSTCICHNFSSNSISNYFFNYSLSSFLYFSLSPYRVLLI